MDRGQTDKQASDSSDAAQADTVHVDAGDPTVDLRGGAGDGARSSLVGSHIDRFEVVAELGAGGMGTVVAAFDPKLDRKVAIKLLRTDAFGEGARPEATMRLMREARAMAKLSAPNVVTVHEVGSHGGEVFVAMELIDGGTLGDWIAEASPGFDRVLDAYVQAGRGLAAAHDAGLVHRDFKPDNVLIDAGGHVKVTDFGLVGTSAQIAHIGDDAGQAERRTAMTELSGGAVALTQTGAIMGTPRYMAPEQHRGDPTDARTDQFSFCIALYEAAYGERPFAGDSHAALAMNVMDGAVREPPASSDAPSWLWPVLSRGLSPNPTDRYPDMHALLAELGRDRGVVRRRLAVAAIAAVAVGAIAFAVWQRREDAASVCSPDDRDVAGVWDDQRQAAVKRAFTRIDKPYAAEAYRRVADGIAAYTGEIRAMRETSCRATRVHGRQSGDLLDRRSACLDRLRDRVAALTTAWSGQLSPNVVARAPRALASLPPVATCADTEALRAAYPPPADPAKRARVRDLDKQLSEAAARGQLSDFNQQRELAQRVLANPLAKAHPPLRARALALLADATDELGRYKQAVALWRDAALAAADARDDEGTTRAWRARMFVLGVRLGRYDEALALRPVIEAALRRHNAGPMDQALLLTDLGSVFNSKGDLKRAEPLQRQALAKLEKLPDVPTQALARVRSGLANTLIGSGGYAEARALLARVISSLERSNGPNNPELVAPLNNLARLDYHLGRLKQARAGYERALRLRKAEAGEDPTYATMLASLAGVLEQLGQPKAAIEHCRHSLRIVEAKFGKNHPDVIPPLGNLANALMALGRTKEARAALERVLRVSKRIQGPDHVDTADSYLNLGVFERNHKEAKRALVHFRRALAIYIKKHGEKHLDVANALNNLATAHGELKQFAKAEKVLNRSLAVYESIDKQHPDIALVAYNQGFMAQEQGKWARALSGYRRAKQMKLAKPVVVPIPMAQIMLGIGECQVELRRFAKARTTLTEALALATKQKNYADGLPYLRFALARALWPERGERKRATGLLRLARDQWRKDGKDSAADLRKLQVWMKTHGLR